MPYSLHSLFIILTCLSITLCCIFRNCVYDLAYSMSCEPIFQNACKSSVICCTSVEVLVFCSQAFFNKAVLEHLSAMKPVLIENVRANTLNHIEPHASGNAQHKFHIATIELRLLCHVVMPKPAKTTSRNEFALCINDAVLRGIIIIYDA